MSTADAPSLTPRARQNESWLTALREDAARRFADAPRPSGELEEWRYSRIGSVDLESFERVSEPASDAPSTHVDGAMATLTIRDGFVTGSDADVDGATIGRLCAHEDGESLYASVRGPATDAVAVLHDAVLADPVLIDVTRGVSLPGPILIDHYSDVPGGLTSPHTIVRAGAGSSVSIVEVRRSGSADQLVLPWIEIEAQPDARVGYVVIQELGPNTVSLEQQTSTADRQSHVVTAVAAFGGSYARVRADFRLIGRGASGDLLAAFFGDGDQMLDFRTFQEHAAPDTTSNLLFKGAVTDRAHSVYTGLIRVAETAPGTNAFQTNRNLKLGDDAWAYSVPNLEIEQNQVSCSHASTVGEIDDDQRFYLESRGVPPDAAERLLVTGFFADVIEQFPVDAVKAGLQRRIDASLAADRDAEAS